MCVYVKDTSRSTERRECVCVNLCEETRVDLPRQGVCVCVYVKDTSRSTDNRECVCVCLCERHE